MTELPEPHDATPAQLREKSVHEEFVPFAKEIFEAHPAVRSAMLAVAQYWADEANDAVHARVIFSCRETPLWPHTCRWDDDALRSAEDPQDFCTGCGDDIGWMPFDDNGAAIDAFQSCCIEGASQDSEIAEAYLPYAVARRRAASEDETDIVVELVGGPIRPWLDGVSGGLGDADGAPSSDEQRRPAVGHRRPPDGHAPLDPMTERLFDLVYAAPADDGARAVLADHLQQKGDPRGEYIALELARAASTEDLDGALAARASELVAAHGETWLGPLSEIVAREGVTWSRGFARALRSVFIASEEAALRLADARAWGSIEEIHFAPQSTRVVSRAMRSLRSVGPLDTRGIMDLAGSLDALVHLACLHVDVKRTDLFLGLEELEIPTLRCLVLSAGPGVARTPARTARNPFTGEMIEYPASGGPSPLLHPQELAPVMRTAMWRRLEEVVIASGHPETASEWLALPKFQRPPTITFTAVSQACAVSGFRVRVAAEGATVDMPSFNAELDLRGLGELLLALPAGIPIAFRATPLYAPTDADLDALQTAARRRIDRP